MNTFKNLIKCNLPRTPEAYEVGNGEGCFFLVDDKTKEAHDNDATEGTFFGILDNDSFDYPNLKHGVLLPLEMRGDKRPVVPLEVLQDLEEYGSMAK